MKYPITLKQGQKLTTEQAQFIFGPDADKHDEFRFELDLVGPWQVCRSLRGLVVSMDFGTKGRTIHGWRTMVDCRQSGYDMEGRVSLGGRKYSCFTSSDLFDIEDGRCIDVATIFPRIK